MSIKQLSEYEDLIISLTRIIKEKTLHFLQVKEVLGRESDIILEKAFYNLIFLRKNLRGLCSGYIALVDLFSKPRPNFYCVDNLFTQLKKNKESIIKIK